MYKFADDSEFDEMPQEECLDEYSEEEIPLTKEESLKKIFASMKRAGLIGKDDDIAGMSEEESLDYIDQALAKARQSNEDKKQAAIQRKMIQDRARATMKILEIPYSCVFEDAIKVTDLYDILMDDSKVKELVAKLNMKAFW